MKRFFKKTVLLLLMIVMLLSLSEASESLGFEDGGIFPGLVTKAHAASNTCLTNVSYSAATAGADKANLPSGSSTYYYRETPWINISVGDNIFVHDAYLYLYRNGSLYNTYHWKEQFPGNNYFRYWANPINNINVGSYKFYFAFTYSSGSYSGAKGTYTTRETSFSVIDKTPSINASSTSVSLNLSGTKSKTVDISVSCDLSYSYYLSWSKSSSAFSASWGSWSGNTVPITFTGTSACSSEPVKISLKRQSDNAVIATKTIYVTVTNPAYTISYNANGGSNAPSSQSKAYNETLTLTKSVPTRFGYTFLGWSTSSSATSATYLPGGKFTSNSNTKLYAVWKQTSISSGSGFTTPITYADQYYYYKFTPSSSGSYVIYSTGSDDTRVYLYNSSGSLLTSNDDGGTNRNFRLAYSLTGGTTYYYAVRYYSSSATGSISVKFGPVYTISYNANGGSNAPSSQKKDYGAALTLSSTVPTRSGYTFKGWSTSSSSTTVSYKPGDSYSSNSSKTLYAVWGSADTTKPTGSISSTNNVAESQTVTLSLNDNVGVAGYYWGTSSTYSNNTYTSTSSKSVTKTISSSGTYYLTVKDTSGNLSSKYSVTFYKTTLNANKGSVSPSYVLTKSGNEFTFPTPTRSGYSYKGWSTSSTATSVVKTLKPTTNSTYYAVWISTDTTKPTGSISSTNDVAESQTVTLSFSDNVGIAGYYWGTSSTYSSNTYTSTSSKSATKTISSSGTYYLTVKDTSGNLSSNYSVTFYKTTLNANKGSVSPSYVLTKSGNEFTFPTPTRSFYTYEGWSTSSSATSGVKKLKPTGNSTYYAVWSSIVGIIKPTAEISSTNNVATSQTLTISLNAPVGVAGYYWGTSSTYDNNTYTETNSTSITKTVSSAGTYYLTVKDRIGNRSIDYAVTFYKTTLNANGGSVSPASVLTLSGNEFTFPTPTRSGYSYKGWATSSSATSGVKTLKPTGNKTYYAVWSFVDSTKPTGSISSTNNVAASQIVTLSLKDNVGIAGYYWGTSSTYSNNTYTATSSTSVNKTISSSGTYYLVVKDTSGNLSTKYSVTFYKTTLSVDGGSVSPTSVLTKSGNEFTFPTPTRSGYSYKGWSTSKSATSGVKTLKPTGNSTYYAIWTTTDITKPTGSISSTNNVAASQTVTLSLNDNVGVAGYYWGTSSTYSSNVYTSTSSKSVTKTVSSAGTYYLTVRDTNGNVSSSYSITFYKTTLNANGGSVSPASVLTKSGNEFTFPTPTKSGSVYKGWSTSSTATSGVKTLKPTGNVKYYAAWGPGDTTKPTGSISSTNNVASSQTVTLSMSDNVGIAGYYWGTSSTYSSNTYTSTSSKSATKTVSSAGTYYLTVKDTSGNVSSNYSITFYKTTLNANGGVVSLSSVLTKSGSEFKFPTATKAGYTYKGWSTSSSATSGVKTLKPTGNKTYYAVWAKYDAYNLKEETYSFDNYSDSDSSGHCFGMSMTSSGYHLGELDITSIGGSAVKDLYSLGSGSKVKAPICYYQNIQGTFSRAATVAGGSYYLGNTADIASDWKAVINYVKDHSYDGSGALQIGYRGKYKYNGSTYSGGHAINFLRYEVVNGQERIYAYDNNFPTTEVYFYKDSSGKIKQAPYATFEVSIDCIALRNVNKYFDMVGGYDSLRVLYADFGNISIENAEVTPMDGLNGENERYMFELGSNLKKIKIIPLIDNAKFVYNGVEYSFGDITDQTYALIDLAGIDIGNINPEKIFSIFENLSEYEYEENSECPCYCHYAGVQQYVFRVVMLIKKSYGLVNKPCACGAEH